VILVDTGPIVAAALTRDVHHRACVDLFTAAHLARDVLAVPAPSSPKRATCSPARPARAPKPRSWTPSPTAISR
jgi:hypothetical protein